MLSRDSLLVHEVWYDHPESNSQHVTEAYSLFSDASAYVSVYHVNTVQKQAF